MVVWDPACLVSWHHNVHHHDHCTLFTKPMYRRRIAAPTPAMKTAQTPFSALVMMSHVPAPLTIPLPAVKTDRNPVMANASHRMPAAPLTNATLMLFVHTLGVIAPLNARMAIHCVGSIAIQARSAASAIQVRCLATRSSACPCTVSE